MSDECSAGFEKLATEAASEKEFPAFKAAMLGQFPVLADRAGNYITGMCQRDQVMVLENALALSWQLREEFNPTHMSLVYYWDKCLQGALGLQRFWHVRWFDGWRRRSSEYLCRMHGMSDGEDVLTPLLIN